MPSFACFNKKIDDDENQKRKQHKKIEEQILKERRKYKATQRLLLLGTFALLCFSFAFIFGLFSSRKKVLKTDNH